MSKGYYLSLEAHGKHPVPIASVSGGDYDGDKLYLCETSEDGTAAPKTHKHLDFAKAKFDKMKSRDKTELMYKLQEAHKNGVAPEDLDFDGPGVREMYANMVSDSKKDSSVELPPDSLFHLLPTNKKEDREIWYISGPSGSGKSYIAKGLVERYRKLYPDREVFLVSKLKEDDTLDSTKGGPLRRLDVQKLTDNPIEDMDDLGKCLIVFDDYDTFTKPFDKAVQKLIDDIATMGRHSGTSILCLSHYLTNYTKTRLLLCEATHFVLYPAATGNHALNYLLQTYLGFDKDEVAEIRRIKSRWICIHKNYPQWIVAEHTAKLLHSD